MIVESVRPSSGEVVVIEGVEYMRYSADNWYVWMGESLEPCFDCTGIEAAYQVYQAR